MPTIVRRLKHPKPLGTCSFRKCGRHTYSFGLCRAHWMQRHRGKKLAPLGRPRGRAVHFPHQGERMYGNLCVNAKGRNTYRERTIRELALRIRMEFHVHQSRAYAVARRFWREGVIIA